MLSGSFLRTFIIDALSFNKISASIRRKFFLDYKGAVVFLYHLVCNNNYYKFLRLGELARLNVGLFKSHLIWLLNNGFSFITIDELSKKIINKEEISSKLITITFDDGFRITIRNVLPILESLKIKATFFITTDWIDSDVLLWQQKYYWYLAKYGMKYFFSTLKHIDRESFAGLNLFQCHRKFIQDILPGRKEALLQQYNRPVSNEADLATDIYLSSKDVLRLSSAGMEIGSHSCGHYFMQNLPDDLYLKEMLESKERLENLLKRPVESFSYPFNSYREDSEIIGKADYKTLCTVDKHKVSEFTSLSRLPRFDAPVRRILFKNSLRRIIDSTKY